MPTVRIDDEVYEWLQRMARPFEDTPNTVLRRVAGLDSPPEKEAKMTEVRQVRVAKGTEDKTPQHAYRKPILTVLSSLGGKGSRMQVLKEVERLMADQLTAYDKSDLSSGSIRWQKSAEWEVRAMREKGYLKPVSETHSGVWALTPKGNAEAEASTT